MKRKTKSALIFGSFLLFNSLIDIIISKEDFFTRGNIISTLLEAIVGGYLFAFVLKGSFGWKNKKEEIRE
ncbi:MAG: hypothetical protein ABI267_02500 [Ginsengibacter sp.]